MKKEKLKILNNKGQSLAVYLFKNNSSDRLVLAIPGLNPFDEVIGMEKAYKKYYSLGNSVCYFDKTGYGKSEGKKEIDLEQTVTDVGSVLEKLSREYKKVILYGPSLGAIPAMISAVKYKDKNIVKLIHVNGFFYLNKYLNPLQRLQIIHQFIWNPKLLKQVKFVKQNLRPEMVDVPTLFVYGDKDAMVNPMQSINMYGTLKTKKELIAIPNGDHFLLEEKYIPHAQRLFDWLS